MQEDDARLLRARLQDFFDRRTPWQRTLWHISTGLGLREVVEYGDYVRTGAHPDRTGLKYVCDRMVNRVALDAGVEAALRDELTTHLKGKPEEPRTAHAITDVASRITAGYIDRWAEALSSPEPPGVELAARSIGSHLLDAGYSSDFLFRWLTDAAPSDAAETRDLLTDAERLVSAQEHEYSVLVPCPSIPNSQPFTGNSLSSEDATQWHKEHCPNAPEVPAARALVIPIHALDPFGAVERVATEVSRITARAAVANNKEVRALGKAWVAGQDRTFELYTGRRPVRVPMLRDHIFEVTADGTADGAQLDDAFQLVSSMAYGTDGAAITNGWAAIEGLLIEPGERSRHTAADHMAAIIACSFARAELTYLAWSHREHGEDEVAERLRNCDTSDAALDVVEQALEDGHSMASGSASDEAALARILQTRAEPSAVLRRVETYIAEALRRLYTQRNQVMHAGSIRSATVQATLRTTPPLVGAGLDRIAAVHLMRSRRISAIGLAARADVALRLLDTPASPPLARLLG